MLADEFAQTIAERRSVGPKQQTHNAPSDDVFVRAARAARSAPSHNPFFPCRFVKVVSREKLADVFESALPPEADQELRDRARSKALKGAACIVIIGPKPTPDTPVIMDMENLMTAGGALTNFLNVLWAEGVAAKTLTSREIKDPQGRRSVSSASFSAACLRSRCSRAIRSPLFSRSGNWTGTDREVAASSHHRTVRLQNAVSDFGNAAHRFGCASFGLVVDR